MNTEEILITLKQEESYHRGYAEAMAYTHRILAGSNGSLEDKFAALKPHQSTTCLIRGTKLVFNKEGVAACFGKQKIVAQQPATPDIPTKRKSRSPKKEGRLSTKEIWDALSGVENEISFTDLRDAIGIKPKTQNEAILSSRLWTMCHQGELTKERREGMTYYKVISLKDSRNVKPIGDAYEQRMKDLGIPRPEHKQED